MEPLEQRRMLTTVAASAGWHLTSKGTLVIGGTVFDDSIALCREGDRIRFSAANERFPEAVGAAYTASRVKRIFIETGDGNDRVHVAYDLLKRVTIHAGAGHDAIDGNAGSVLVGGGGNDRLFVPDPAPFYVDTSDPDLSGEAAIAGWNAMAGPALLSGGAGDDVLVAAGRDSVVGGRGSDVAFQHILIRSDRSLEPVPNPADSFGDRASGVEAFVLAAQRWPAEGGVWGDLDIVLV